MNTNTQRWLFLIVLPLWLGAAQAQEGSVTILSPTDGETLGPMGPYELTYEVEAGPRGDHIHIYVDDREVGILRVLKGSHMLKELAPGARNICIKVVNRGHTPIGVDGCVTVHVPSGAGGMRSSPAPGMGRQPGSGRY